MENEKDIVFRNALAGYNKTDVNEYIAGMAQEFARRSDEWETEKEKLIRARNDELTERENCEKLRDELACQYYEAWVEARHAKDALEAERAVSAELRASTEELTAKIHELEASLAAARETAENAEDAAVTASENADAESAIYEKLSEKVDQIMETANESAREIVASALARGDEIIAEAEKRACQIREDAAVRSETAYYDEVMRFAAEIRDSMNKLMKEIGAKKAEVDGKLSGMRTMPAEKKVEVVRSEKKQVSSIDEKIERFFKNTLDTISGMTGKKK